MEVALRSKLDVVLIQEHLSIIKITVHPQENQYLHRPTMCRTERLRWYFPNFYDFFK